MSDAGGIPDAFGLNLLLFSVGGVFFGADAEQVEETLAWQGDGADDLVWFHRELGYAGDGIAYRAPSVLKIRTADGRDYRVIIDQMEDVTAIVSGDIRPFPPLVEPFALRKGMWGIVVKGDRMILLVDFKRLLREQRACAHMGGDES